MPLNNLVKHIDKISRFGQNGLFGSAAFLISLFESSLVRPIQKSQKLADVCYDIRGPVMEKAKQMEDEGQKSLS